MSQEIDALVILLISQGLVGQALRIVFSGCGGHTRSLGLLSSAGGKQGLPFSPNWPGPVHPVSWNGFLLVVEGVHFPDTHKGICGQSLATQHGPWAGSTGIHRSLLEMQDPTPHPRPLNRNLRSRRAPGDSYKHITF